jgi:hypothetical protein
MHAYTLLAIKALLLFFSILPTSSFAKYSGGAGEPNAPYRIADANDLLALAADANDYDDCFILINDINLGGYNFMDAVIAPDRGGLWEQGFQGPCFSGVFDGNGHVISNLNIIYCFSYVGLFGYTEGQIRNLGIENVNITGEFAVGGLAGHNSGTISSCYSVNGVVNGWVMGCGGLVGENYYGSITDSYNTSAAEGADLTGGLVGSNSYGNITNCYSEGLVTGYYYVGGLAGGNMAGSITCCHAHSEVTGENSVGGLAGKNYETGNVCGCYSSGEVSGKESLGGLVGKNDGNIIDSYSTGTISGYGDNTTNSYIGGLAGANYGNVERCYSTAAASGRVYIGGLVGWNEDGADITDCYSAGSADGNVCGGLVGRDWDSNIINCYSTTAVDGNSRIGGLVGLKSSKTIIAGCFWDIETSGQTASDGGEGKTTEQMKMLSTFDSAGWDFIQTWNIGDNQTYPFLRTYLPGDINHDGKIDFYDFSILALQWLE